MLSIWPHLNDQNVAILSNKDSTQCSDIGSDSQQEAPETTPVESDSSPAYEKLNAFGELSPLSIPGDTPEIDDKDLERPSDTEAEISSSSDRIMSTDSDIEAEIGGIFFDDTTWRCEECCVELIDGECPSGCALTFCQSCNRQLADGLCPKCSQVCETCGTEAINGGCRFCAGHEDSDEEDLIVYNTKDHVWRCLHCQREVEADNDDDAYCRCLDTKGFAHYLDLSDCPDFKPAYSWSSDDESSDEEPDSEDGAFIDDEVVANSESVLNPNSEIADDAALTGINGNTQISQLMAAQAEVVMEKLGEENTSIDALTEDVDIGGAPAMQKSIIIDCESMEF